MINLHHLLESSNHKSNVDRGVTDDSTNNTMQDTLFNFLSKYIPLTEDEKFGVGIVKWIVKNTPFKYFNQKLKLKNKIEKNDLHILRGEMTSSEIEHLIGFVFVTVFALVKCYKTEWLFGLTMMVVNIFMNLHPSLIQQQNKRRIDKFLKKI